MNELARMMATFMPATETARAKCPECGGALLASVTIYTTVPVTVETVSTGDRGVLRRRALYGRPITETKAALDDQVEDNYTGAEVDERDDIYCENYGPDGCEFHTTATRLELPT